MKDLNEAVRNFKNGVKEVAGLVHVHPTNVRRALEGEFNSPKIRMGAVKFLKAKLTDLQKLIALEDKNSGNQSKAA